MIFTMRLPCLSFSFALEHFPSVCTLGSPLQRKTSAGIWRRVKKMERISRRRLKRDFDPSTLRLRSGCSRRSIPFQAFDPLTTLRALARPVTSKLELKTWNQNIYIRDFDYAQSLAGPSTPLRTLKPRTWNSGSRFRSGL
jgi:hypothetical protein